METMNSSTFTGFIKKAGNSRQIKTTVVANADFPDLTTEVRYFQSANYLYQQCNGRSVVFHVTDGTKSVVNSDNWHEHEEKLLKEWAGMLADQKPRTSKADPEKAGRLENADRLLAEIVGKTDELKSLGFKLAYSWKSKRYEIHPLKAKVNGQTAQQTTDDNDPIGHMAVQAAAQATAQQTTVTTGQGVQQ